MSFTTELVRELCGLPIKKTCCRRAFILGLLMAAEQTEGEGLRAKFYEASALEQASEIYIKMFRGDCDITEAIYAGRRTYFFDFECQSILDFLSDADKYDGGMPPHELVGFRCGGCQSAFLRGVLCGSGSITDPKKAYHMELTFPTEGRAMLVSKVMEMLGKPNKIKRASKYAVYYKNNNAILDMLYYVGSVHQSTYFANSFIARDIRNQENRATNCVARNISLSVAAAQKQLSAIEALIEGGRFDALPEELRYTATLRMENPAATLSELALMHNPPITKSGLNGRLARLMEAGKAEREIENRE